jgi:hypothetical protein
VVLAGTRSREANSRGVGGLLVHVARVLELFELVSRVSVLVPVGWLEVVGASRRMGVILGVAIVVVVTVGGRRPVVGVAKWLQAGEVRWRLLLGEVTFRVR